MSILQKPIFTEKSYAQTGLNRYTFEVDPAATKHQIKAAVESLFKVNVVRVNIQIRKPLTQKSYRTGRISTKKLKKIAVVQLKPKQTIKLFNTK